LLGPGAADTGAGLGGAKLHFIPTYCPHLDSIERLWRLMHKHVTHNRCHETFAEFRDAILTFLREQVPRNWRLYCDSTAMK
jgi:transposase